MKILLSGGKTGGSVTPLLAIVEELKNQFKGEIDFLWLGTKRGMERKMVEAQGIKFKTISSGKFRRYFALKNFIDPFFIILGFFQSLWINLVFSPDMILTAGGFVAVPVVFSGWLLRIPISVHQQDVETGLANKLMMPFAKIITYSLNETAGCRGAINCVSDKRNTYFTGNAIRKKIFKTRSKEELGKKFNLEKNIPTVLILGGGTGSLALNNIVIQTLTELTKFCQVIHITGGKMISKKISFAGRDAINRVSTTDNNTSLNIVLNNEISRYHPYPFLGNIEEAFTAADLVISRCGMSFLSEFAVLGKPTILIPMPDSHQELNAKYFADRNAAIVLDQKKLTPEILLDNIKRMLGDKKLMEKYSENIKKIMPADGTEKIAEIVLKHISKKGKAKNTQ